MIRRHLNYANITATIALVFAMSGGALAASHYLITSTKQIKPSVLKSLKGANGKNGASGANGTNGTNGAPGEKGANGNNGAEGKAGTNGTNGEKGPEGSPWTAGGTLPAGKTETGTWTFSDPPGIPEPFIQAVSLSFPIPLGERLEEANTHFVKKGETAPKECDEGTVKGTVAEPKAAPGNLCIYSDSPVGKITPLSEGIFDPEKSVSNCCAAEPGVGKSGALVFFEEAKAEEKQEGDWAVTELK